ncbi:hypothetical protein SAMN05421505_120117 [Sinosporangium album]|uniref:Uncharacterized protein n=1 Tax=Sinosporangium album TaxID=504805 RepID=A0A1G8EIQ0_9ACTN|nr:hypothetical protein [Sinosporangium album]SDH69731.1 hypothetical protein SAMN05421505_120117 [Sinosporangium album]
MTAAGVLAGLLAVCAVCLAVALWGWMSARSATDRAWALLKAEQERGDRLEDRLRRLVGILAPLPRMLRAGQRMEIQQCDMDALSVLVEHDIYDSEGERMLSIVDSYYREPD